MTTKKKTPTKKKKIDKNICPKDKNGHCFHFDDEGSPAPLNSYFYPPRVPERHCCLCGMNELDRHGPFHPQHLKEKTIGVTSATTMVWTNNNGGNSAVTVPPMNGSTVTTLNPESVRKTLEKLMTGGSHYECSSDCGCKQPIVIKKPTKTA